MFQTIIFAGNLGRDPEMRFTPSGASVASFSVATNRSYKNSQGEDVKETVWFRVSVWGKMAEVCNQYLKKGSKVLVEGRLTPDPATGGPRIWKTEAGEHRSSFEVNANTVKFLSTPSDGANGSGGMVAEAQAVGGVPVDDEDLPF